MPRMTSSYLRAAALLTLCLSLQGCIVATVVDTALDVAVGTVKVGAAVVGGTVKVAAAGVRAASDDDEAEEDKNKNASQPGDASAPAQPAGNDTSH